MKGSVNGEGRGSGVTSVQVHIESVWRSFGFSHFSHSLVRLYIWGLNSICSGCWQWESFKEKKQEIFKQIKCRVLIRCVVFGVCPWVNMLTKKMLFFKFAI